MTRAPVLAWVLLLTAAPAWGQSKVGTTIGQFLLIEPSARIAAMGNAGATMYEGLDAAYYNPAAAGRLNTMSLEFSHSLWLADGTNYPGQDDLRARRRRLLEGLGAIYADLEPGMRLLVEYKFFEPGFYHTDLADWGTAYSVCCELGPQAEVLVESEYSAHRAAAAGQAGLRDRPSRPAGER